MLPCVDENCVKVRKIVGFIFFIQRTIGVGPEEGGKFSLFGVVRDTGIQDSSQQGTQKGQLYNHKQDQLTAVRNGGHTATVGTSADFRRRLLEYIQIFKRTAFFRKKKGHKWSIRVKQPPLEPFSESSVQPGGYISSSKPLTKRVKDDEKGEKENEKMMEKVTRENILKKIYK